MSQKLCAKCSQPAELMCPRCFDSYCSSVCQRADWPTHRTICFRLPVLVPAMDQVEGRFSSIDLGPSKVPALPQSLNSSLSDDPMPLLKSETKEEKLPAVDAGPPKVAKKVEEDPPKVEKKPEPTLKQPEAARVTPTVAADPPAVEVKKQAPLKVPFVPLKAMKFNMQKEAPKPEVKMPMMRKDLPVRAWPSSKKVRVKFINLLETNIITFNEDNPEIDALYDQITKAIALYVEKQKKADYKATKGEVVLGLFEGSWYRAYVIDAADDGCIVQFIEYGNMDNLKSNEVMPAPEHFMFEVCTRDYIVDNMPENPSAKQIEILQSGIMTITNISKDSEGIFHCDIFGF